MAAAAASLCSLQRIAVLKAFRLPSLKKISLFCATVLLSLCFWTTWAVC